MIPAPRKWLLSPVTTSTCATRAGNVASSDASPSVTLMNPASSSAVSTSAGAGLVVGVEPSAVVERGTEVVDVTVCRRGREAAREHVDARVRIAASSPRTPSADWRSVRR